MNATMTSPMPPTLCSSLVTPVPSSESSVASGSGSGSDSDVSSLAISSNAGGNNATANGFNAHAMYMNSAAVAAYSAAPAAPQSLTQRQLLSPSSLVHPDTPHHPIAEFLYQLTKMLTDDNVQTIEWTGGRIHVHDPHRLADQVLHKYFRHSKYASFQRQLNYFGFRKIAGKGKMSPCSYVNDAATDDIRSLLFIKRKTNGGTASKKAAAAAASAAAAAAVVASGGVGGTSPQAIPSAGMKRKAEVSVSSSAGSKRPNNNGGGGEPTLDRIRLLEARARVADAATLAPRFHPGAPVPPPSSLVTNSNVQLQVQRNAAASAAFMQAMANSGVPTSLTANECLHFPTDGALTNFSQQQQQLFDEKSSLCASSLASQQAQQQAFVTSLSAPAVAMPCPATAAMNAAMNANQASAALFESSANLSSLLTSTTADPFGSSASSSRGAKTAASSVTGSSQLASSSFLSSLPSSNTLFPDSLSSISLNRMIQASSRGAGTAGTSSSTAKRIPSLLGMSNFLSRESSLVDLAMLPSISSTQQLQSLGIYMEPTPIQEMNGAGAAAASSGVGSMMNGGRF